MQTFLPYGNLTNSAKVLDMRRLGKQRVECKQIYLALTVPDYGWQNHPAVKQWRGYEQALVAYGRAICKEWISRGYKDTLLEYFNSLPCEWVKLPQWYGNETFHSSHRQVLLSKDFGWYSQFGWREQPKYEYWWPTQNGF